MGDRVVSATGEHLLTPEGSDNGRAETPSAAVGSSSAGAVVRGLDNLLAAPAPSCGEGKARLLTLCGGCGFPVAPSDGRCPLMDTRECSGPNVYGVTHSGGSTGCSDGR